MAGAGRGGEGQLGAQHDPSEDLSLPSRTRKPATPPPQADPPSQPSALPLFPPACPQPTFPHGCPVSCIVLTTAPPAKARETFPTWAHLSASRSTPAPHISTHAGCRPLFMQKSCFATSSPCCHLDLKPQALFRRRKIQARSQCAPLPLLFACLLNPCYSHNGPSLTSPLKRENRAPSSVLLQLCLQLKVGQSVSEENPRLDEPRPSAAARVILLRRKAVFLRADRAPPPSSQGRMLGTRD